MDNYILKISAFILFPLCLGILIVPACWLSVKLLKYIAEKYEPVDLFLSRLKKENLIIRCLFESFFPAFLILAISSWFEPFRELYFTHKADSAMLALIIMFLRLTGFYLLIFLPTFLYTFLKIRKKV